MTRPPRRRDWHQDFARYPVVDRMPPRYQRELEDLYHSLRRFGMALELDPPRYGDGDIWTVELEYAGIFRRLAISPYMMELRDEREAERLLEMIAREAQHVFMSAVMMAPEHNQSSRIDMQRPRFMDDFDRRPLFTDPPNRRVNRPGVSLNVQPAVGGAALQHAASTTIRMNVSNGPTKQELEADYRV